MIGVLIITIFALIISIILVLFNKEDKESEYLKRLPGYNCGVCGYAGCKGMSKAMLEDVNNYKKCKLLKGDALIKMKEYVNK